jgi:hypothetical protein
MADPKLEYGYFYRSSRRHPRRPEHGLISPDAPGTTVKYVGKATIEGREYAAFRVREAGQRAFYAFQLHFALRCVCGARA